MKSSIISEAPEGTRMWLLHVGNLIADEGFILGAANSSTASIPNPENKRRSMVMISVLISHPTEGLVLFETGPGKDYPEVWGPQLADLFAREDYSPEQDLDAAIKKTGNDIKDVKAVIMGHLHLDHAGGLEYFCNKCVPIYVHELELKHAFYSVATKTDLGVYLPTYLRFNLNWVPFHQDFELAPGIGIRHSPGHTPGLVIMVVNLQVSGAWIFTTDHCIVHEHLDVMGTQGWFTRDQSEWLRSNQNLKFLQKQLAANVVFGHDREVFLSFKVAPEFYQ